MKKNLRISAIFMLIIYMFVLSGCSSKNKDTAASQNKTPLTKEEFKDIFINTNNYKGRIADFYARIILSPEKSNGVTYIVAYAENDKNKEILITSTDPKIDLSDNDVIHVVGPVAKKIKITNALAALVEIPVIAGDTIKITPYSVPFSPSLKTVTINKEINHDGFVMKLKKVEIAKEETRIYLTVRNESDSIVNFYNSNSKLTQGNIQFERHRNDDEKVKKIQNQILPNHVQEGVLIFKPAKIDGENLKITLETSSEDYSLDFKPFEFEVPLK